MDTARDDWPYDPRSDQVRQEQERDRQQMQDDLEKAWINIMIDRNHAAYFGYTIESSEDDIKLLKRALGIK